MNETLRMFQTIISEAVIDRCLAAASFYLEYGNDRRANALMKEEFREIAREVARLELSGETKVDLFLLPMREELVNRHGQQVGRMIFSDFVDAFWIQSWTDIPLDPVRLERASKPLIDWHDRVQFDQELRRQVIDLHLSDNVSRN